MIRADQMTKKEACLIETLETVNDLLKFMTNLDYVKEMIHDANSQSDMLTSSCQQ